MKKEIDELLKKVKCFDNQDKLRILNHLMAENEATFDSINKELGLKKSTTYKYIKQMIKSGIISYKILPGKKGKLLFKIEDTSFSIDYKKIKELFKTKEQDDILIIFDVDDTLVRREDIVEQLGSAGKNAINEARLLLQEKGLPISMPPKQLFDAEWIHTKYGNSIEWYISTWLEVSGVPEGDIKKNLIVKHVKEYYKHIEITSPNCNLFKDVKPFLSKLKNKVYFAAISNSSKKTILETFRKNNILNHFMKNGKYLIVGGDEIPKSKETIEEIFKMSGISAKNSFMIGDTGGDIKAAREAGISQYKTIAISRDITPIETLRAIKPPVKIIKDLSELNQLI